MQLVSEVVTVEEFCSLDTPIRILSYNIQVFGRAKMSKPAVVRVLLDVIKDYDVVQVQEIRDSSQQQIKIFLGMLNELVNPNETTFGLAISSRQGRSSSKEQVGFIYRKSLVYVIQARDWEDFGDIFERDPFAIQFGVVQENALLQNFTIIGVHVSPGDVVKELDALLDIHASVAEIWGTNDILLAGDFNADCGYLTKSEAKVLRLRDPAYTWLINDDMDSTVAGSSCAYDRFIATGTKLVGELRYPGVVRVDRQFNISDAEFLKDISDHYPITVQLM